MNRYAKFFQYLGVIAIIDASIVALGVGSANAQYDYTYDALGRVVKVEDSAASKEICFSYDSLGNRIEVSGRSSNSSMDCNLPPVANNDSITTNEDTLKNFDPRSNDTDDLGQALTITAKTNGSKGSVAIINSGTQLRYTPNANQNGSDSFTYTISDGTATDSATVNVTINAVNDAPIAYGDLYSGIQHSTWNTFSVRYNDTDIDSSTLTITALSNIVGSAQIISNGTQVRYWYSGNAGEGSFTYTLSDGSLTDTASVTVLVVGGGGGGGGGGGFPLF